MEWGGMRWGLIHSKGNRNRRKLRSCEFLSRENVMFRTVL